MTHTHDTNQYSFCFLFLSSSSFRFYHNSRSFDQETNFRNRRIVVLSLSPLLNRFYFWNLIWFAFFFLLCVQIFYSFFPDQRLTNAMKHLLEVHHFMLWASSAKQNFCCLCLYCENNERTVELAVYFCSFCCHNILRSQYKSATAICELRQMVIMNVISNDSVCVSAEQRKQTLLDFIHTIFYIRFF